MKGVNLTFVILGFGLLLNFCDFIVGICYEIDGSDSCKKYIPYGIWMIVKSLIIILFYIGNFMKPTYMIIFSIFCWLFWIVWLVFGMIIFWSCNNIPIVAQTFTYISIIYNISALIYIKYHNHPDTQSHQENIDYPLL